MTSSLLFGLALAIAAPAPKEAPKKDAPTAVGVWTVDSSTKGGKADNSPPGGTLELMADGKMVLKENGKDITGTYTTDTKKDPAEIDLRLEANGANITLSGIFKFEGDALKICLTFAGDRPTKFESPDGSMSILLTLKRAKKE